MGKEPSAKTGNPQNFSKTEQYGLVSQMRRLSAAIPTNIAEGTGRGGQAELARFLQISMDSASELEYQLIFSHHLEFMNPPTSEKLTHKTITIKKNTHRLHLETDNQ